jgi:polyisoprenoid-binding protein YceI
VRRRALLAGLGAALLCPAVSAAPGRWRLDSAATRVTFFYTAQGMRLSGSIPLAEGRLDLDPADIARSEISVTLDARGIDAGFGPATRALHGQAMFAVADHPTIRFASNRVAPAPGGARIEGVLTIRGITRPLVLAARFPALQQGAVPVALDGRMDRFAFGLAAYPRLVDRTVDLAIRARLSPATPASD